MAADRRTKYTKSVIRQALFELLTDRPINKITVTDICKKADINRSTFYSYYEDVYALLTSIQNDLFEDIVFTLSKENWFEDVLKLVDDNKDLCQVLLGPHGDSSFIRQLIYLGYENSMKVWKETYPNATPELLDYFYAYMSSGVIGVLENWVCSDYKLSTQEVGKILMGVTMQGLNFLEENDTDK
ncbi:MAG: TetR/AcrR family transcriptional regulator C-terminal domain-containing protein [Lachnospiraceae bacterium]|nr:TetR/AcrR family transcriptional regulator C-terminal domain-containing protein [Lachnospiraceae bacterium]